MASSIVTKAIPANVSPPTLVEYAIQGYGDVSDAVAYTYQQEGHASM